MDRDRQRAKELFQQMTLVEKIKYIYEEFRFHILAVLVAAAILISLGTSILNKKTEVLWGVVINQSISQRDEFIAGLEEALGLGEKECVSLLNEVYLVAEDLSDPNSLSYGSATQLICAAAVCELDFVITDEDGLIFLQNDGLCKDIEEVLSDELLQIYGPYLYTPEELDAPIAIDLKAMGIADSLGLKAKESYLALPNMSGHEEHLFAFLEYISDMTE